LNYIEEYLSYKGALNKDISETAKGIMRTSNGTSAPAAPLGAALSGDAYCNTIEE